MFARIQEQIQRSSGLRLEVRSPTSRIPTRMSVLAQSTFEEGC